MDATLPPVVEIIKTERHNIRDEVVEHVARLLCRADGKNPDEDVRMVQGGFQTVHIEYPSNMRWAQYRGRAEEMLRKLFNTAP